jgi:hypothetical protein
MKENIDKQRIQEFYNTFKNLSGMYSLEKVHQIINSPATKAKPQGTFTKPLKIFIMTSLITCCLLTIALFIAPNKEKTDSKGRVTVTELQDLGPAPLDAGERSILQKSKNEPSPQSAKENSLTEITTEKPTMKRERQGKKTAIKMPEAPDKKQQAIPVVKGQTNERPISGTGSFEAPNQPAARGMIISDWPQDTILDKKDLMVEFPREILQCLGIFVSEKGVLYQNFYGNLNKKEEFGKIHIFQSPDMDLLKPYCTFPSKALFTSNLECNKFSWESEYYSMLDTLVPIYVAHRFADSSHFSQIFWFEPMDTLFSILPSEYKNHKTIYQNLKHYKNQNPNKQWVNYMTQSNTITENRIKILDIKDMLYPKINVVIKNNSISIVNDSADIKYELCLQTDMDLLRKADSLFRYKADSLKNNINMFFETFTKSSPSKGNNDLFPYMITDTLGVNQRILGEIPSEFTESTSDIMNFLIPIRLPVSKTFPDKDYELILWYFPTQALLSVLEENEYPEIAREAQSISDNKAPGNTSCSFFEVYNATVLLENLTLFPNPAQGQFTLSFHTPVELKAEIVLTHINGSVAMILESGGTIEKGIYNQQFDISNLNPGIYLLVIQSDKGYATQRIIKK